MFTTLLILLFVIIIRWTLKSNLNQKVFNKYFNIYLRLIFGVVNTINTYLRLKIRDVWQICSLKGVLIELAIPNLESDLFLYIRNLQTGIKRFFDKK